MIEFLKLKNFKGINTLMLNDISHINVIAGKNNSGKSSVLECIAKRSEGKCSIGIKISDSEINLLIAAFELNAKQYSQPRPSISIEWFKGILEGERGKIYYDDNINEIINYYRSHIKNLGNYSPEIFQFSPMLNKLFDPKENHNIIEFVPVLVPAKRKLDEKIAIDFDASSQPNGKNMINRLFNLKNQDVNSGQYKIFMDIYNTFKQVTNGVLLNIIPQSNNLVIRYSDNGETWLSADECGLGLQDILVIISNIIDTNGNIIMIEEPENHIHPDMQRRLLQYMQTRNNQQFLLTTHSNVFLDSILTDKVYFTRMKNNVEINDETNRASVLKELGYSVVDNLVSDLVILTEGPSDAPMIEELCKKMGFWSSYSIKIWPLGGDIMSQLDLSAFVENIVKTKIIALIDSDGNSKKERNRFKKKCKEAGITCVQLKHYAIENYIPLDVLRQFPEFGISENITKIDPSKKLESQIKVNVKRNMRKIAQKIELDTIKDTDLYNFCKRVGSIVKCSDTTERSQN